MERKLYMSLAATEELASALPDEMPALRLLLALHSQVIVDATKDELEAQEEDDASYLKILHQQTGTFKYGNAPAWPQNLSAAVARDAAGALFVLEHDIEECEQISKQYGVCAVSRKKVQIADYLMRPLARKELEIPCTYRETVGGQLRQGWYAALTVPELLVSKAPLNALVVIDTYLFNGGANYLAKGKDNLKNLLRALLPPTLDIDFHLLLVAANSQVPFDEESFATFSEELERELNKPYKLQVGLITRPLGGKDRRSITSNYYFCTSQHGFTCFTNATLVYSNDFIATGAFESAGLQGFHLPVRSMSTELKIAKKQLVDNIARQSAPDAHIDSNRRYLGFCDNRLLTLVP